MSSNSQRPFFEEVPETPNNGLSIEVTIEPFVKSSLEIEEKEHQLASF